MLGSMRTIKLVVLSATIVVFIFWKAGCIRFSELPFPTQAGQIERNN